MCDHLDDQNGRTRNDEIRRIIRVIRLTTNHQSRTYTSRAGDGGIPPAAHRPPLLCASQSKQDTHGYPRTRPAVDFLQTTKVQYPVAGPKLPTSMQNAPVWERRTMVRSISFLLGLFEASTMRLSLSFLIIGMHRACGRMGFAIAVCGEIIVSTCVRAVSRDAHSAKANAYVTRIR
jgi:hypothetical protein